MEYNFEVILIRLVLTIFSYLLVPVIVLILGKTYSKQTLKRIVIINGITIWLVWGIFFNGGNFSNGSAAFLWSSFGYWLLKRKCLLNENGEHDLGDTLTKNTAVRYCKYCGSLINNETKQCTGCQKQYFRLKLSSRHLFIFIIALLILNIVQFIVGVGIYNELSAYKSGQYYVDEFGDNMQRW